MAKINSKQKGKRAELEVAKILRDHGYLDAHRTAQYCGNTGEAADVDGVPGFHLEVKHQETTQLDKWWAQAVHDSDFTGRIPVLVHRKNGQKWKITMDFEMWLEVVKDYVPF